MTWRTKKDHFTNYTCKWRKTDLGKTNPNHRYFMRLLNNLTSSYLKNNKSYLLANKPEIYYSMINRPLPKKYLRKNYPIAPVNAYIPPQSKLSREQLNINLEKEIKEKKEKEQAQKIAAEKKRKEQERIRYNRETFEKERRYIYWVDPTKPINQNRLGSSQTWRKEKKYKYYD